MYRVCITCGKTVNNIDTLWWSIEPPSKKCYSCLSKEITENGQQYIREVIEKVERRGKSFVTRDEMLSGSSKVNKFTNDIKIRENYVDDKTYYSVYYKGEHVLTLDGNLVDMLFEALQLIEKKKDLG